jgi:cobyrinic acid a,c-diamide synthase
LFISAENKPAGEDRRLALCGYAKNSSVFTIPTNHVGLYTMPAVDELAQHLQNALELVEAQTGELIANGKINFP